MGTVIVYTKEHEGYIITDIREDMPDSVHTITSHTTHHGNKGDEKTYSNTVYKDTGEIETIHVKVYKLKEELPTDKNYEPLEDND